MNLDPDEDLDADPNGTNPFADAETPLELLGLLAGAASACWSDLDNAGVFQPDQATRLVNAAMERLMELGWGWT